LNGASEGHVVHHIGIGRVAGEIKTARTVDVWTDRGTCPFESRDCGVAHEEKVSVEVSGEESLAVFSMSGCSSTRKKRGEQDVSDGKEEGKGILWFSSRRGWEMRRVTEWSQNEEKQNEKSPICVHGELSRRACCCVGQGK
jgi:hypothetical protein